MTARTETQSIEIDADRDAVLELLSDPHQLPEWAPAFADSISGDVQSGWRATKDGQDVEFRVLSRRDAGTVDFLRDVAPDRQGGAYLRVVPRPGGGAVVVMTLPLTPGVDPAAVATTLRDELDALARLAQGG